MIITGFKQIVKNKIEQFESGVRRHKDKYLCTKYDPHKKYNTDCFVQFNIYNPYLTYNRQDKVDAYKYVLNTQLPFLVCEEGAMRQLPNYKRWGWTSYKNGIGNFNNSNVDNSRWLKIQKENNLNFSNWKSLGDNILIMGQLEGDSALIEMYDAGYKTFDDYILDQIKQIRNYTDRPIVVRPHPLGATTLYKEEKLINDIYKNVSISKNYNSTTTLSGGAGLQEDFNNAYCVVTYSSNSCVEAIEKGIPIFTLSSTSSAYDIGHKDISQIENLDYSVDISTWCNKIAYTIWNSEEIANGTMWEHLRITK
jgi:hypothetical protein|tara:strand:+ start:195 stop:1121 length:927 start_codon:yes stop_codon:yes gene_type:complete